MSLLIYKNENIPLESMVYNSMLDIIETNNMKYKNDGMSLIIRDLTVSVSPPYRKNDIYILKMYGDSNTLLQQLKTKGEELGAKNFIGHQVVLYFHNEIQSTHKKMKLLPPLAIPSTVIDDINIGCIKEDELPIIVSTSLFKNKYTKYGTGLKNIVLSELMGKNEEDMASSYITTFNQASNKDNGCAIIMFPNNHPTEEIGTFKTDIKSGLRYSFTNFNGEKINIEEKETYSQTRIGFEIGNRRKETYKYNVTSYEMPILDLSKRPDSFSLSPIKYEFTNKNEIIKVVEKTSERYVQENKEKSCVNEQKTIKRIETNYDEEIAKLDENNKNDFYLELITECNGFSKGSRFMIKTVRRLTTDLAMLKEGNDSKGERILRESNNPRTFNNASLKEKYKLIVRANKMQKYTDLKALLDNLGTNPSNNKVKVLCKAINLKLAKFNKRKSLGANDNKVPITIRDERGFIKIKFDVRIDSLLLYLERYDSGDKVLHNLATTPSDFDKEYFYNQKGDLECIETQKQKSKINA